VEPGRRSALRHNLAGALLDHALASPRIARGRLLELDAVQSAAIVGVEDHDGLTRVVAAVAVGTGTEPPDPGRLHAHCAEHLAPHEVPRAFAVVAELPTTPSGKLVAPEMRRLARSALKSNREAA